MRRQFEPPPQATDESLITLALQLINIKLKLVLRRLVHSPAARRRAALGAAVLGMTVCTIYTAVLLPSHAPAHHAVPAYHGQEPATTPHVLPAEAPPSAASTAPVRPPAEDQASSLRQRAAELSLELDRIKGRAAGFGVAPKQQQSLRATAEQLDSELAALKQRQRKLEGPAGSKGGGRGGGNSNGGGGASGGGGGAVQSIGPIGAIAALPAGGGGGSDAPVGAAERGDGAGVGPIGALTAAESGDAAHGGGAAAGGKHGGGGGGHGAQCPTPRHPEFRIAMLLPWLSSAKEPSHLPSWLPFFLATAAHSSLLVDWLVFHEGGLQPRSVLPDGLPSNVHIFELKAGGMASLVGRTMSAALGLPAANTSAIINRMRFMFQKWPRLIAEYKPAFGAVFAQYLPNYTHWGYSDMDIVLGQLPRFIERAELMEHHIVTYSFGDMEAVYLRGQWTMHQNTPKVNDIWMGCKHLGAGLQNELFNKVAWARRMEATGKKSYHKRFLSAEGCYSYRAAFTEGLRIKVAIKQFVGLQTSTPATEDVYVLNGALWLCQRRDGGAPDVRALRAASTPACDLALPGVQTAAGELRPFNVTQEGCGNWMPQEFRLCATELKGAQQRNQLLADGEFWSQGFEEAPQLLADNGRCRQGAFFHMQEWKKRWGDGATNIDPAARHDAFRLSQDGIHALAL